MVCFLEPTINNFKSSIMNFLIIVLTIAIATSVNGCGQGGGGAAVTNAAANARTASVLLCPVSYCSNSPRLHFRS